MAGGCGTSQPAVWQHGQYWQHRQYRRYRRQYGSGIAIVSPIIRPIGISPALESDAQHWYPGSKWPPREIDISRGPPITAVDKFPMGAWDPVLHSVTVLGKFLLATTPAWNNIELSPWPKYGTDELTAEITELVELIDYRAAVMDEALAQLTDIVHYWSGMLMFSQGSHPWTFRLAQVAVEVGAFVVFQYKMRDNRPRPSQLCPWLMPPVAVPPHA